MKRKSLASLALAGLLTSTMVMADDDMPPMPPVDGEATIDDNTGQISELDIKVKMKKGWNMFGLPGYKSYKPVDLLGHKDFIELIYWYHPDAGWKPFNPKDPKQDIVAFVPGMAIWIKAKKPFVLSFKTNIPSNLDVYEVASFIAPKSEVDKLEELKGDNLYPPMPISTASYSDTWTTEGVISEKFTAGVGTKDWTIFDPTKLDNELKTARIFFDLNLLVNKEFKDETNNLKYRFKPDETAYNALKVAIRNTSGAEAVGNAFLEQGKFLVLSVMGENGIKKVKYEIVEIVKDGTTTVLRLKNESKQPAKWVVSSVYNNKIGSWTNPKDLENQNLAAKDADLKDIDWDKLSASNADKSFAFVADAKFVPKCAKADGTLIELKKKPDGTYPFPGDPYFPAECKVDDKAMGKPQDIKAPTTQASSAPNAPILEKETQLIVDMENCKPYTINFNPMFKNQPERFGLYWRPEGAFIHGLAFDNKQGLLKGFVNSAAGAYNALVDASNRYGVSKQLQVVINVKGDNKNCANAPTGTASATPLEFKPNDAMLQKAPVCKDPSGKEYEVPKTAAGYYAMPQDPEFPKECKNNFAATAPRCQSADGSMIELKQRPDGSYPFPHEEDFPKECKVAKPASVIQSANLLCDLNKDGKVDDFERKQCAAQATNTQPQTDVVADRCDTNKDGKVDDFEKAQCAAQATNTQPK